jgi:uncharacterized surface protein with fasciclin (FAS1) repeats
MKISLRALVVGATLSLASLSGAAYAENPMVGGMPMFENKDIIDNAVTSPDHTTLVAAVQAAGLVETLKGAGPFTVFAPTNEAFAALPAGTVDTLLKPESKDALVGVLTYHVVPGKILSTDLVKMISDAGGTLKVATVQGGELSFAVEGDKVVITDGAGGKSTVTIADVVQSNGVIHVVDHVLLPSS